jgi:hypothetical protein
MDADIGASPSFRPGQTRKDASGRPALPVRTRRRRCSMEVDMFRLESRERESVHAMLMLLGENAVLDARPARS